MPVLKIEKKYFQDLMGQQYTFEQLDKIGFEFGIEVEEAEEEVIEGETNHEKKVYKHYWKFQCQNNRPDLLTEPALTRILKIYMQRIDTPVMKLTKTTTSITVHPSVKQIRPFVVGAVLRGINFTPQIYKTFINAQQKLHATFCRARKWASIGTHDLDKIKGPFKYIAKDPKQFKFTPLNQDKEVDGLGMMQSLQKHKLKEYLPLIKDSPVYPLILDCQDRVCSVPPIINSQLSKISVETRNVFIEVTALSQSKAMVSLLTLVWSFSEYLDTPFQIQPVEILDGEQKIQTPVITEKQFCLSHRNAEIMVGTALKEQQIVQYLKRMGIRAQKSGEGDYRAFVPAWRVDVLHECDLLEDIAICYGYHKICPTLPPTSTIGSQLKINKFTDHLRHQMAQIQFNEALNFALCSKADLTTNILNEDSSSLITIENAKTKQFQTGRTTLLPGLLRTIVENKALALPYKLFETGECIVLDPKTQTGARNIRKIAAVYTDQIKDDKKKGLFSVIHGVLDILLAKCNLEWIKDYSLKQGRSAFYFPGQQFEIWLHGSKLGTMGVVEPFVLRNFGWFHPTVMWQLDICPLEAAFTKSYV